MGKIRSNRHKLAEMEETWRGGRDIESFRSAIGREMQDVDTREVNVSHEGAFPKENQRKRPARGNPDR